MHTLVDGVQVGAPIFSGLEQTHLWVYMSGMPLLQLETTIVIPDEKQKVLLASLSKTVAEVIGKPEKYVMVAMTQAAMAMSGTTDGAAFVDVRSIGGLGADINRRLSRRICEVLKEFLRLPPDRVYLDFVDVEAGSWGWNGSTFG